MTAHGGSAGTAMLSWCDDDDDDDQENLAACGGGPRKPPACFVAALEGARPSIFWMFWSEDTKHFLVLAFSWVFFETGKISFLKKTELVKVPLPKEQKGCELLGILMM